MFRWAVAGLAVFSVGMAAGGLVHHQMTTSAAPDARPFEQATAPAAPAPATVVPPETGAQADTPMERLVTAPAPSEQVGQRTPAVPAFATPPSAGEGLVAAAKPDRQLQTPWTAPAPTTTVKIARVTTTSPTLRNNPIVRRELTRDIQRELYRVGCYSVIVTGNWDARTVKASAQFIANRNAVLPANRPDVILLSLLRSYQGGECGRSQEVAITAPALVAPAAPAAAAAAPNAIAPPRVGPVTGPATRSSARTSAQPAPRRRTTATAAGAPRKQERSWRQKIHYGTGSDW